MLKTRSALIRLLLCLVLVALLECLWNYYIAHSSGSLAKKMLELYAYRYPNGRGSRSLAILFELPAIVLGGMAGYLLNGWRISCISIIVIILATVVTSFDILYYLILPEPALWWLPQDSVSLTGHVLLRFVVSVSLCV